MSDTGRKKTNRDLLAEERRQQILDIARRLFAEKGFHATSMRELNKEIGMAEALTYHYFPGGKYEILQAVLQNSQEKRMANILTSFSSTFRDDTPLREVLLNAIDGFYERFMNDKEYFQILLRERSLVEHEQLKWLNRMAEQPFEALVHFLKRRAELDEIRQMDFEMAASQLISHVAIGAFQHILFGKERDSAQLERMVDFYVKMWST
ncbi:AcrR family transcriptional regulator [Paenibacillus rhizosphaerae]|uniref:AcrR family transcriptional regulator n=1 Tax=Paenibacillus rhizosphaerae TaxID=297318 RepID=A0A839TT97_9BACL|nr:TetR/AcrR family transcriptional regulator [Paenibacillus rhizosphaerae]MBB3128618.1 AcrR family transcriptional regulator [Paenibacillus rhizosphaerae]